MTGTKVGEFAQTTLDRLPADCPRVSLHCPDGACPTDAPFECDFTESLGPPEALLGTWNWAHQRPVQDNGTLMVRGGRSPSGVTRSEIEVTASVLAGNFLAPSTDPPATAVSTPKGRMVHFLVRPEAGLNLAALVADGSWSSQLFSLKSELFEATTLEGTLEFALYEPSPQSVFPPFILAVPVTHRDRARAAIDQFIDEIRGRWPIEVTPLEDQDGQCLTNLELLPALAPCYVMTDRALVLGWNFGSLRAAGSDPAGEPFSVDSSHLEVDFAALSRADDVVRAATHSSYPKLHYPWSTVRIGAVREDKELLFRLEALPMEPTNSDPGREQGLDLSPTPHGGLLEE